MSSKVTTNFASNTLIGATGKNIISSSAKSSVSAGFKAALKTQGILALASFGVGTVVDVIHG
jgi:hypothetical protein